MVCCLVLCCLVSFARTCCCTKAGPSFAQSCPAQCCHTIYVTLLSGCAYWGALVCHRVKGKSIDEVLTIKNSDIAKHLSLPPVKLHCSMLAEDAIKAAVKDVQAKRAKMAASKQQSSFNTEQSSDQKLAAAVGS